MTDILFDDSLELLQKLIRIPSFSKDEEQTASEIELF